MLLTSNHIPLATAGVTFAILSSLMFAAPAYSSDEADDVEKPENSLADLSIEQLMQIEVPTVFSASRYEQTIEDAPASVTIIGSHEIKGYGYRNLGDLLQSVRGFHVSYDRAYHFLGFRGFSRPGDYNTRVLLLIDGVRTNDNIYDQAPIGNDFPLDIDLIDRVEIIRGPSHSLYGSNAFFGLINIVTKRGRSLKGAELSAEAGGYDTYKGRISFGTQFGTAFEALLSATQLESIGQDHHYPEFDTPDQNNGWTIGNDGERYKSVFLKARYTDLTLEGGYLKRFKTLPTAPYGSVFNSSQTVSVDTRAFLDLKYEHQFDNRLGIMARTTLTSYRFDGDYLYDTGTDRVLNSDLARGDAVSAEFQLTSDLFRRHKIVAGGEIRYNYHQDQFNTDATTAYLTDLRNSLSWALFIQNEYTLLPNLALHAGVRFDHFSNFGSTTNPRAALVYTPLAGTTLKFLYGTAFRAPNAYELHYSDGDITMRANPRLREERITSYEAMLLQDLGPYLTLNVNAYYNQMKNIIDQVADSTGLLVFENTDSYRTCGIEGELQAHWTDGIQGRLSYAYQDISRHGTSSAVFNSPRHLIKLNILTPLIEKKLLLGIEEQFTSARNTLNGSDAPEFFITNLTLSSRDLLFKGLEVSATVYNLLDRHYESPSSADYLQNSLRQDGRGYRLKVTYAF